MRLTKFSDYALRVLMLAAAHDGALITIDDTASGFGISPGHLKKVVLALSRAGLLQGVKGRSGGYRLAARAEDINLGAVLRITETDFQMFECVQGGQTCPLLGPCQLPALGRRAVQGFLAEFDQVSLADLALPRAAFRAFSLPPAR